MDVFGFVAVVTFFAGLFLGKSLGKSSGFTEGRTAGYKAGFIAGIAKTKEMLTISRMSSEEFDNHILIQEIVNKENLN